MSRHPVYSVEVSRVLRLSPHMKRVVLCGPSLDTFPDDYEGGYIKLLLPREIPRDAPPPTLPAHDPSKLLRRSFTVRAFDRGALELTLDVVEHPTHGPAARWLRTAETGDPISIIGPGAVQRLDASADWIFAVGDMAALPAISTQLERLPETTIGHVFLEVPSDADKLTLIHPPGVQLHWVIESEDTHGRAALVNAVFNVDWHPGRVSVWVATEFQTMKAIRAHLCGDRGLERRTMYISSYWKRGSSDEGHKAAKRLDTGP